METKDYDYFDNGTAIILTMVLLPIYIPIYVLGWIGCKLGIVKRR